PGGPEVTEEVREAALDEFDLPLLLREQEPVWTDEPEGSEDQPIDETFRGRLIPTEAQVHRVDQVKESDEAKEEEQHRAEGDDPLAPVRLLVQPHAGLLEFHVRHASALLFHVPDDEDETELAHRDHEADDHVQQEEDEPRARLADERHDGHDYHEEQGEGHHYGYERLGEHPE